MQCLKNPPLRDPAYRRSAKGRMCDVPDCEDMETVVLAHLNIAGNFGRGLKAGDDESLFLCIHHHQEMDQYPAQRDRWIVQNIVIPLRKLNYRGWKADRIK